MLYVLRKLKVKVVTNLLASMNPMEYKEISPIIP